MKAVTLHGPWAWAVCHLGKNVKNRDWSHPPSPALIGQTIAIHAGSPATWTRANWLKVADVPVKWPKDVQYNNIWLHISAYVPRLAFSALSLRHDERDRFCSSVVATAVIDRIEPPTAGPLYTGWRVNAHTGIYLRDVSVLQEPVKIPRGQLGFWNLTPEQEAAVVAAGRLA